MANHLLNTAWGFAAAQSQPGKHHVTPYNEK